MSKIEIVDASQINQTDTILARGTNVRTFTIETDLFFLGIDDVVRLERVTKSEAAPAQVPAPQS